MLSLNASRDNHLMRYYISFALHTPFLHQTRVTPIDKWLDHLYSSCPSDLLLTMVLLDSRHLDEVKDMLYVGYCIFLDPFDADIPKQPCHLYIVD